MASAHEAASGIRKWALSKNLMPALPADLEAQYVANVQAAQFSDDAEIILRQRGITSLSYNNKNATVSVYTKRRMTQKDVTVLPDEIFGCAVIYPQGDVDGLGTVPTLAQGAPYSITHIEGRPYYSCGSSISPGNSASAGTMGALVCDAVGTIFGLTNNHVTGGCSHSGIGLPILAPGVLDVMPNAVPPFTIGLHSGVLSMVAGDGGNVNIAENTDAALFRILNIDQVSSFQGDKYDTPTVVAGLNDGQNVEKVGRTTRHTVGRVVGRELLPIHINVAAPNYGFHAVILFPDVWIVHGDNSPFSDGGDSGSLVVLKQNDGSYAAVGLVFAGGPDSKAPGNMRTLILPIGPILQSLGVTLVGGHHAP